MKDKEIYYVRGKQRLNLSLGSFPWTSDPLLSHHSLCLDTHTHTHTHTHLPSEHTSRPVWASETLSLRVTPCCHETGPLGCLRHNWCCFRRALIRRHFASTVPSSLRPIAQVLLSQLQTGPHPRSCLRPVMRDGVSVDVLMPSWQWQCCGLARGQGPAVICSS